MKLSEGENMTIFRLVMFRFACLVGFMWWCWGFLIAQPCDVGKC